MKSLVRAGLILVLAVLPALAQTQPPAQPPLKGSAIGQVPTQPVQPALLRPATTVVIQERTYYSGVLPSLAKGKLLKRPRQPESFSPVQNPEVDLMTHRPRGIILFSIDR